MLFISLLLYLSGVNSQPSKKGLGLNIFSFLSSVLSFFSIIDMETACSSLQRTFRTAKAPCGMEAIFSQSMQPSKNNSVISLLVYRLRVARLVFGVLPLCLSRFPLRGSIFREASSLRHPPASMVVSIRFINQGRALIFLIVHVRETVRLLLLFAICVRSAPLRLFYFRIILSDYWSPARRRSLLISSVG